MVSINAKTGGLFKNAKIIWLGIAVLLVAVFFGTLTLLQSVYQTETYYVLNQDVPTRTQITMDMLTPVVTSVGTAPGGTPEMDAAGKASERDAILAEVQSGGAFAQFPLVSGDVLSPSNVAALSDISVGVPDTWVITSFSVDFSNAIQGRIQRGSYFDMMVVGDSGAYYPFVNILALETSTGGATSSAEGQDASGQNATTSVYTVGMSPENAGKLQWLTNFGSGQVKLVLSPRQNEYASPDLRAYAGMFYYDPLVDGVIAPGLQEVLDENGKPVDLDGDGKPDYREVTDYTFSDVERDAFGRPLDVVENVGLGNAKIPASAAGGETPTNVNAGTNADADACEADGGVWMNGTCDATGDSTGTTPTPKPTSTPEATETPEDETSGE